MTQEQVANLKIGDKVYFDYRAGEIASEIRDTDRVSVSDSDITMGTCTSDIFLPTEHVITCSELVRNARQKFEEIKCFGANVNPHIYGLFISHWIDMCNAENDYNIYLNKKALFTTFVNQLYAITNQVNDASVQGVKFLRM